MCFIDLCIGPKQNGFDLRKCRMCPNFVFLFVFENQEGTMSFFLSEQKVCLPPKIRCSLRPILPYSISFLIVLNKKKQHFQKTTCCHIHFCDPCVKCSEVDSISVMYIQWILKFLQLKWTSKFSVLKCSVFTCSVFKWSKNVRTLKCSDFQCLKCEK